MNGSKANVKRSNLRENNSLDISEPRKSNLKFRPYKISYFFAIKDHILITTRLHCSHTRSATCSSIFQEAMMRIAAVAVTATRRADQETQSPRMVKLFALNRTPMRKILIPPYQVFLLLLTIIQVIIIMYQSS